MARVWTGDAVAALDAMRQAVAAAQEWVAAQPGDEAQLALENAHLRLAMALRNRGDINGAREQADQALAVANALYQKHPDSSQYAMPMITVYNGGATLTGVFPTDLVDWMPASNYERAFDLAQRIVKLDPSNGNARRRLNVASTALGWSLRKSNPRRTALLITAAVENSRRMANSNSQDPSNRTNLIQMLLLDAETLRLAGEKREALTALREAIGIAEPMSADPDTILIRLVVTQARAVLAGVHADMGHLPEARSEAERAREMAGTLFAQHPADLRTTVELSLAYEASGEVARREHNLPQARSWFQRDLDLWISWPQRGVSSDYDRKHAQQAARSLAECK